MRYIEPHGHMVSRTTDDYMDMVTAVAPAFANRRFGPDTIGVLWTAFMITFAS